MNKFVITVIIAEQKVGKVQSATIENWNGSLQPLSNKLEFIHQIALEEAKKSLCVRRKYGSVLFSMKHDSYFTAHNARITSCCDGVCIRERLGINHGFNTDLGAEIHSEQSLLINVHPQQMDLLLIAGYGNKGQELFDRDCWPCYNCARVIKASGLWSVFVPTKSGEYTNYSLNEIFEHYENEFLGSKDLTNGND